MSKLLYLNYYYKKKSIFFKFQEWGSISNPAILWIFEISLPKKRKKLFHGWMNWKRKMIQNEIFSNSTWWVEVDRSQLGKHIWSNPLFFFKCQSSLVLWKEAIANVRKRRVLFLQSLKLKAKTNYPNCH